MNKIAKIIGGCLIFSVAALAAAQTPPDNTLKRIKQEKKIRIAYRKASTPFSYSISDKKRPVGYSIDICLQVAESVKRQLGLPELDVEWVEATAKERFTFLDQGKADMECSSTTNNAERHKKWAFSVPFFITGLKMLVLSEGKITGVENLIGKTVTATKGTTGLELLKKLNDNRLLNLTIVETTSDSEGVEMLIEKKAVAVFNDEILLAGYKALHPEGSKMALAGEFLSVEPYAIMMRQDPEFNRMVNQELTRMVLAKEIDMLYAKWFTKPTPPKDVNFQLPMNHLLRDSLKFPSERIP